MMFTQPLCPICQENTTSYTYQVDDEVWQDVCSVCADKLIKDKELVVPIQIIVETQATDMQSDTQIINA